MFCQHARLVPQHVGDNQFLLSAKDKKWYKELENFHLEAPIPILPLNSPALGFTKFVTNFDQAGGNKPLGQAEQHIVAPGMEAELELELEFFPEEHPFRAPHSDWLL